MSETKTLIQKDREQEAAVAFQAFMQEPRPTQREVLAFIRGVQFAQDSQDQKGA